MRNNQLKTIGAKQPMLSNEAMQMLRGAWVTSRLDQANIRHGRVYDASLSEASAHWVSSSIQRQTRGNRAFVCQLHLLTYPFLLLLLCVFFSEV